MKYIATNIVNPISADKYEYLPSCWIGMENGEIRSVSSQKPSVEWEDKLDCICLPGLIDSHVHLSQYDVRGAFVPDLLKWLNKYIFPAEYRSSRYDHAYEIATRFYKTTLAKGTTTTVVYTSPFKEACQAAFQVAEKLKVRSVIGMTMMDMNCPDFLRQSTDKALKDSDELCSQWQGKGLLDYIFSPRFAVTCSRELLKETGIIAEKRKARIQSHLAENQNEIKAVDQLFPECSSYSEVYSRYRILGSRTIMGHALHLQREELKLLQETDTRVAFCPESNFFLKSGKYPFGKMKTWKIKTALASDVGAGTNLSMFEVMKLAEYTLSQSSLMPSGCLYYSTLAAAEVLGLEDKLGSIQSGKAADLVFVKHSGKVDNIEEILSRMIFLNHEMQIDSTWVNGIKLYPEG